MWTTSRSTQTSCSPGSPPCWKLFTASDLRPCHRQAPPLSLRKRSDEAISTSSTGLFPRVKPHRIHPSLPDPVAELRRCGSAQFCLAEKDNRVRTETQGSRFGEVLLRFARGLAVRPREACQKSLLLRVPLDLCASALNPGLLVALPNWELSHDRSINDQMQRCANLARANPQAPQSPSPPQPPQPARRRLYKLNLVAVGATGVQFCNKRLGARWGADLDRADTEIEPACKSLGQLVLSKQPCGTSTCHLVDLRRMG